jgi:hypothetical protein
MGKNGEGQIEIQQKLRGPKPDNVTGRMKPRQLINTIRQAQRDGNLDEDEESWRELEPYLRDA